MHTDNDNTIHVAELLTAARDVSTWRPSGKYERGEEVVLVIPTGLWAEGAIRVRVCCETGAAGPAFDEIVDDEIVGTIGTDRCWACGRVGRGWARSGASRWDPEDHTAQEHVAGMVAAAREKARAEPGRGKGNA